MTCDSEVPGANNLITLKSHAVHAEGMEEQGVRLVRTHI